MNLQSYFYSFSPFGFYFNTKQMYGCLHRILCRFLGLDLIFESMRQLRLDVQHVEANSRSWSEAVPSVHESDPRFPQVPPKDELEWQLHEFTINVPEAPSTLNIILNDFAGLEGDFRYLNTTNHQLYIKLVALDSSNSVLKSTSWMDLCNVIGPLGILPKDGSPCLIFGQSSLTKRVIKLPSLVPAIYRVYINMGLYAHSNIQLGTIQVL